MLRTDSDVFRETPLRYLGYANEVGEAFRRFIGGKMVMATYGLATAYALGDAAAKGTSEDEKCRSRALEFGEATGGAVPRCTSRVAAVVADVVLWQGLASVAIPGFCVNRVVWAAGRALKSTAWHSTGPTAFGLACIPLMVKPIDEAVTGGMDAFVRPYLHS